MLYPLRLCLLVSREAECKWSRFLGEVGHSHRPMLGPGYAVAKTSVLCHAGPLGLSHTNPIICSVVLVKQEILKFAASIYKMKDPLQGMSELVVFSPINLCCEYSFMVPAWAPW